VIHKINFIVLKRLEIIFTSVDFQPIFSLKSLSAFRVAPTVGGNAWSDVTSLTAVPEKLPMVHGVVRLNYYVRKPCGQLKHPSPLYIQ
jgi:hypothetical protein